MGNVSISTTRVHRYTYRNNICSEFFCLTSANIRFLAVSSYMQKYWQVLPYILSTKPTRNTLVVSRRIWFLFLSFLDGTISGHLPYDRRLFLPYSICEHVMMKIYYCFVKLELTVSFKHQCLYWHAMPHAHKRISLLQFLKRYFCHIRNRKRRGRLDPKQ